MSKKNWLEWTPHLLTLILFKMATVDVLLRFNVNASILSNLSVRSLLNATGPCPRQTENLQVINLCLKKADLNETLENSTINNYTKTLSKASIKIAENTQNPLSIITTELLDDKNSEHKTNFLYETDSALPLCISKSPYLGPVKVFKTRLKLNAIMKRFPEVKRGGWYTPTNCTAKHKVAILVPYRDRQRHLTIFLNHMHPFLMKQKIEYGIFVIEQAGNKNFNRGKLINVGFVESQKVEPGDWKCFIFHDVDLLPLNSRNLYTCPRQPRHMSASINKIQLKLPYDNLFGGVSALTRDQFIAVNGYSNKYWGWGGEDDDMSSRLRHMNYEITRYKPKIGHYMMLNHKRSPANPKRYKLLSDTTKTFQKDGISNLDYELIKKVRNMHPYFDWKSTTKVNKANGYSK